MPLEIQSMAARHWTEVVDIYKQGMATGNATFETEAPSWNQWQQSHLPECRFVASIDGAVVGWAALSAVSRREVYRGVAEVSVYVAPKAQRMGVGKSLLERLITCAEENGLWTLQASMFPENEASLRLHLSCGFRIVGRREKIARRQDMWRDTLLLERRSTRVGLSAQENETTRTRDG